MASAAGSRAPRPAPLLSIGQVLARLTPEFPDLSPSKLRFLEERGLISPARTASGYRKFCAGDVERLRVILSMQRDRYLPLKVIKNYLSEVDAGLTPLSPGGGSPSIPTMLSTGHRRNRYDLVRDAGATPMLLRDAISAGLLAPADVYGDDAFAVLRALVELQRCGIEPRHLRAFRTSAERELGLIESALLPVARGKNASSRAHAAELAREISSQLDVVRSSLIRSALDRLIR